MKIDYKDHYNDDYFTGGKKYRTPDGKEHAYHGPALTWGGFSFVADGLAKLLPHSEGKNTLLDIGCSGGDLCRRLKDHGFDPWGVDISEFAIRNAVPEMRNRVAVVDISETPERIFTTFPNSPLSCEFPSQFDVLIATDLLEHIYYEDLDRVFDWMVAKTKTWMFFCVAITESRAGEFVHKKGEPVPIEMETTAVSGHVNVRTFGWWVKFFRSKGLIIDFERMYTFQMRRELIPEWKGTGGWNMGTTFFLKKR